MPPDSKEIKLENSIHKVFSLTDKNDGVVLVSCSTWKCFPAAISGGVDISKVPLMTDEFSVRVHKNYFKDCCLINSQPTFLILTSF